MIRQIMNTTCLSLVLLGGTAGGLRAAPLSGEGDSATRAPRFLLAAGTSPSPAAPAELSRTPGLLQRISIDLPDATLREALETIAEKSDLRLLYSTTVVPLDRPVHLRAQDITVADALSQVLLDASVDVVISGNHVALVQQPPAPAQRQIPTGTLTGRVTQAGEPVAGVTVTATSASRKAPQVVTTGDNGDYELPALPSGAYSVRFELEGLVPVVREARVSPSQTITLDVQMSLHEVSEDMVVTGTHIRGVPPDSSPITIYNREEIERSGAATTEQFLRKVPQNFSNVDATTALNSGSNPDSNTNSARGAGINLRGLGLGATLVLLDGQRMAPTGTSGGFVDVSLIPLSAIERIEILTDGASALYGADAIAGVVNFILRKDFSGAETSLRGGSTTRGGGREIGASQFLGRSWGGGNAMLLLDYYDLNDVSSRERDFIPPPEGGPIVILPGQERESAMLSARQALSPALDLFGRVQHSKREFLQDQTLPPDVVVRTSGDQTGFGGQGGVGYAFPNGWRAELVGDYSRAEVDLAIDQPGLELFNFRNRSELASVDLRADGSLFSIPGGQVRGAFGAAFRREDFDADLSTAGRFSRDVTSVFGEVLLPLAGEGNAARALHRLELSLAARLDDYDDVGSSGVKPKVGLLWSPLSRVNLRGTYAESFRPPLLDRLDTTTTLPFRNTVLPLPNPDDPNGVTATIFSSVLGNPDLTPEESRSFTFGFDVRPDRAQNVSISGTYYDIDFEDQVALPPLVGTIFDLFTQTAELAPFIAFSPDSAVVESLFAQGVNNPFGIPASSVGAIYDNRWRNIASTRASGVELSIGSGFSTAVGNLSVALAGDYILKRNAKAAVTTPAVSLFNKAFTPADLKLLGSFGWSRGGLASTLGVNYVDSYKNTNVTPVARVDSWVTADWQVRYELGGETQGDKLRGLTLSLSMQNVTDEKPPFVAVPANIQLFGLGFDATNASPLGRVVSAQIAKRW